jgi:PAS domain-containing protein
VFDRGRPSWQALCTAVRDAPLGIGVCDEDGRMLAVSTSLAGLLRRSTSDIVGRPFLAFVHPDDRPTSLASYFEAVVAAAAGVRNGRTRVRCLTGDHDTVTVEVTWTVTEGDEATAPCGILYLVALPGESPSAVPSTGIRANPAVDTHAAGCEAS